MNRNIFTLILLLVVLGIGTFIYSMNRIYKTDPSEEQVKEVKSEYIDSLISQIETMSLDEKIGQMLIVGFENIYVDSHIKKMIEKYHIGGINLLARNVESKNQIQKLTADLQKLAYTPLFIAADQEGGDVIRFKFLRERTSQLVIQDEREAERVAFERALELKNLGVNMNFSPVTDYVSDKKSYMYARAFRRQPETVGFLAKAMILGYKRGGVIPVAKHFPGYGNIVLDPHQNEATLLNNAAELEKSLIPFNINGRTFIRSNYDSSHFGAFGRF